MNQLLKFRPILKDKIWGGEKLIKELNKESDRKDIGESWEISDVEGDISVVANPDTNGNSSSMVAQMVKGAGQPWAGSKITVPTPFNFEGATTVTVKVWSPRAGLNLLLKFDSINWTG